MMTDTPESVTLVPIDRIEVLNSRDRNMKVFEEIVENIRAIGLKKPITVAERSGADGAPAFVLVCGEGRLNAFRLLGETHIPALVIDASDEDAFIMSLAENIARRGYRPLEILADIELLLAQRCSVEDIIDRTGLSEKYVRDIVFLLEKGEERLIGAVQNGTITLSRDAVAKALNWPLDAIDATILQVDAPFRLRKRGVETKVLLRDHETDRTDRVLLRNIANARVWLEKIEQGQSFEQIAAAEGTSARRIRQLLHLAFLAPDILRAVVQGQQPIGLTTESLKDRDLPLAWNEQRAFVKSL